MKNPSAFNFAISSTIKNSRFQLKATFSSLAAMATMVSAVNAATVWIGNVNGGDGASFFQEANWDSDGNVAAPYTTPAANSINPGVATSDNLVVTSATLTNISNPTIGNGYSLDLQNASIATASTFGASGVVGGATSTINLSGTSVFNVQSISNGLTLNVGSGSILRLRDTGTPVNSSLVNLANGGTLEFINGTPTTLNAASIFNSFTNTAYSTTGDISASFTFTGTQAAPTSITAIPEPSTALLGGLGILGLLRRRRA